MMQIGRRLWPVLALSVALALLAVGCGDDNDTAAERGSSGVMLVLSNSTDPSHDDEFNRWYDEHVREMLEVPGVASATRYVLADEQPPGGAWPARQYLVIYELRDDDLDAVRERIRATSESRTHSSTLEMDPLPINPIYRQIRDTVTP